jgi:DNA-binding transcriptional MerR regulator
VKKHYSVKQLARLAGVSVRTLHLYDEIGLLKPSDRTEAGYRFYEEKELFRLQQILFYKELDFALKDIGEILDDPEFDKVKALEGHRAALLARKNRLDSLLTTIEKTIQHIKKGDVMLSHEELYEGLPKEKAEGWRKEAREKWGNDAVERSEMQLLTMTRENLAGLKTQFAENWKRLAALSQGDHTSAEVQDAVRLHYKQIRQFWGTNDQTDPQWKAYKCLGEMYLQDDRYTMIDGQPNPAFAAFLCKAIAHFVASEQH